MEEGHCECCGNHSDNCICPECTSCGAQGDFRCYQVNSEYGRSCTVPKHDPGFPAPYTEPLSYSKEQLIGQIKVKLCIRQAALDEDWHFITSAERNDEHDYTPDEVMGALKRMAGK